MVSLAAIWGMSFVFYRVGAPLMGPVLFVFMRVGIGAAALIMTFSAIGKMRTTWSSIRNKWKDYVVMATLNAALPFALIATGELTLSAGFASIMNATSPIFSAIIGALVLGHSMSPKLALGLFLGMAGVVIVVGAGTIALTSATILATCFFLAAAFSYAMGALYTAHRLKGEDPFAHSLGMMMFAALIVLPVGATEIPTATFSTIAIVAAAGIGLMCTGLAYLIYFHILGTAGPTRALSVTFLTPIFGVLWGNILLQEEVKLGMILGLALVLVGVGLVTTSQHTIRVKNRAAKEPPLADRPSEER
jgi:drug/metabolite transporter (DMT)-like permease